MLPPLLANENIAIEVVAWLRNQGVDVVTALELGLRSTADTEVLERAVTMKRVLLTLDSDFGMLAFHSNKPVHGVLYVRYGDQPFGVVIEKMAFLLLADVDWTPPFVAVLARDRFRLVRLGQSSQGTER